MLLSLSFFPKVEKPNSKTGKIPMYLRITFNRKKAEMRLNVEINQQELSKWDEVTMRFADRSMAANAYLNSIEKGFEDFKYHNASTLNTYNIRTIRSIVMGMDQTPAPLIMHYVDKYYSKAIAANAQMTEGTKRNYRKAFTHLKNFLVFRKSKDASLKDFNIGFAFEFKDYLLGTHPNTERIGMSEPSALDNIKRLRTVFDRAVDEELLVSNPLKKIKLKAKAPQRGRLDINQVRDIYKLNLQDFPTQQLYKDMFLFSIFTGLAYADAANLKQTDLNKTAAGDTRLFLKRAKTEIVTEMILPQPAIDIINKYKYSEEVQITGRVLPRRSNKEVNVQLKILARMVGIQIKLSTHIARHTFRQLLAEADIYEQGVIKRMMGHSSSGEIDSVYYVVTESRLMPGRTYNNGNLYRYGFQGKEKSNEITNGAYDFEARVYDARLGRTFSVDPAYKDYPWLSGYSFLNNNPLSYTDVTGKRFYFVGGAGNDQDGWNYTNRFAAIFSKKGIKEFRRVNASGGKIKDMAFTATYKNFSYVSKDLVPLADGTGYEVKIKRRDNKQIEKAVNGIVADLAQHPLKEGEQLNLSGYSYGSVLQANVALRLADMGIKVDNLILIGSPISDKSELYNALTTNKNIGKVIREDIKGDKLSNSQTPEDFKAGIKQSAPTSVGGMGDNAPHFDLARPGAEANKKINELGDKLKKEGVQ